MNEKIERNTQIYLDKTGFKSLWDKKRVKKPLTYRELSQKYNLSVTFLQRKIGLYQKRYSKQV